jgi:adenylate cyclase
MTTPWQLRVYEKQQLVHVAELTEPVELGRQSDNNETPGVQKRDAATGGWRMAIARLGEDTVSRKHLLVEPLPDNRVRLTNLSRKLPVRLVDGRNLQPQESSELEMPAVVAVGSRTVRIQRAEPGGLQSLDEATLAPGEKSSVFPQLPTLPAPAAGGLDAEALVCWLQAAMGVLQSATTSLDFFSRAAQALVELVSLDSGQVLLLDQDQWTVQAVHKAAHVGAAALWQPSRKVLNQVLQEKRTCWLTPSFPTDDSPSLAEVRTVVAAPILNRGGDVIGALYGDRRQGSVVSSIRPFTKPEAMLVELLATGVAAGLARVEQEQAALRARVQFEQFFTPELSRQLAAQPDLLQGRDAEVTVLFGDICGFSSISERLGPAKTVEWINDVLGMLSDCVRAHRGVLVDYTGDELMAMWGAPETQADHAQLACRAALAMLAQLPDLAARWQPTLGEPTTLGIGINTGMARVGNTGSRHKFKYGPLGTTVNLASRVQGATRYLKSQLLITGMVHAELPAGFDCRRLCRVRAKNIAGPVELFELVAPGDTKWADLKQGYEEALNQFEARAYRPAARILGRLLTEYPYDGPSLVLLSRTVNSLVEEAPRGDTVWELPGK